ncbi:hypothetical protein OIO90_002827 [Microbotryomycetes sp. JL221]|nr:hypothetical protein OIO90_002827 [Microbotryomycetes sp. JL221]
MLGRLGLPTGLLFGPDPKLEFRKPGQGIHLLPGPLDDDASSYRQAIPASDPYWQHYWTLFDSTTDVITLVDSYTLSQTIQLCPTNLHTLVDVLYQRLTTLLSIQSFPHATLSPSSTTTTTNHLESNLTKQALNCVRVLSRILPFIIKPQTSVTDPLEEEIFWTTTNVHRSNSTLATHDHDANNDQHDQFVIDDDDDDNDNDNERRPLESGRDEQQHEWQHVPPLAERLLKTLVDLLFVPGFTVPEACRSNQNSCISYVIWEPGIASNPKTPLPPSNESILSTRLEILRLLSLSLSLPSLLTAPHLFHSLSNRWRDALVVGVTNANDQNDSHSNMTKTLKRNVVLCLLCCLMNTAFGQGQMSTNTSFNTEDKHSSSTTATTTTTKTSSSLSSLAMGAADKFGQVLSLRKQDVKGMLTTTCLQLLGQLMIQHAPPSTSSVTITNKLNTNENENNSFNHFISKLHRSRDFNLILNSCLNNLEKLIQSKTESFINLNTLPLSTTTSSTTTTTPNSSFSSTTNNIGGSIKEMLIVLWKCFELNSKLFQHLIETDKVVQLLIYLFTLCLEHKHDENEMGLVRLCIFLIQTISAQKGLNHCLNLPIELKSTLKQRYEIPSSSSCTLSDFIIISIHQLIFKTNSKLNSLYLNLILILNNCSNSFKQLSESSSIRLGQLFLTFSNSKFLLMEEGNPRLIYYLLETFNNVIHFQLSDNPELIYVLLKCHKRFETLSTFTLNKAIKEINQIKVEKQNKKNLNLKQNENYQQQQQQQQQMSEKSKGKRPERQMIGTRTRSSLSALSVQDLNLDEEDIHQNEDQDETNQRQSQDENTNLNSDQQEQVFVGKNGFVPTEAWVSSWRSGLPLDSIMIMLSELGPLVVDLVNEQDTLSSKKSTTTSTTPKSIISLLSSASLNGLLPPEPNLIKREFNQTPQSITWLASLIYGNVYLSLFELMRELPVQLFGIATHSTTKQSGQQLLSRFVSGWNLNR